jgi:hypothetical protein
VRGITKEDIRSLLYLVSLGVVGAATVGVFFGAGLMWLIDPRPVDPHPPALPADPVNSAQALRPEEFQLRADTVRVWGLAPDAPTEQVKAISTSDIAPNREVLASRSTATETLVPRARVTHSKRVRFSRHRPPATGRYLAALWRPDASAGPNPGGGFYGPPNSNVGYINPKSR